jgi:hypothetical protein
MDNEAANERAVRRRVRDSRAARLFASAAVSHSTGGSPSRAREPEENDGRRLSTALVTCRRHCLRDRPGR